MAVGASLPGTDLGLQQLQHGAGEVRAGLGFHDGEPVGGAATPVSMVAFDDLTRLQGTARATSACRETGFSSRHSTGRELR